MNALDTPIAVTFFKDYAATESRCEHYAMRALATRIEAVTKSRKGNLPWLKCATFGDLRTEKNSLRHDANILSVSGIEADYDGEAIAFDEAHDKLEQQGIAALLYTSPSHTEDTPRWRVLCPLSTDMPPNVREKMVGRLNGLFRGVFSGESFTLSQAYYFGSINHNPSHRVALIDGTPIDEHHDLDEIWQGRPHTEPKINGNGSSPTSGRVDPDALILELVNGSSYHQTMVRLAGHFAHHGVAFMEARQIIVEAMDSMPVAQRDKRWHVRKADIDRIMVDIFGKEAKKQDANAGQAEQNAPPPDGAPPNADDRAGHTNGKGSAQAGYECALASLEGKEFKPIMWIVPDYIPEGLTVFAGKPKIGKSWLILGVALAVARGTETLGRSVEKGDILYCGLEDGERRMQSRVLKILGPAIKGWPTNFTFRWKLAALDAGGLDYIEGWLIAHPERRLVVIDTLGKVRGMKNAREEPYQYDYRLIGALQNLATQYRVAIVVVHHVRKTEAEDVLDTVSGTTGIAGAADSVAVLGRNDKGTRLYVRGRDCEEQNQLVEFDPDTGIWEVMGEFDEIETGAGLQGLRKRVFDLLNGSPLPLLPVKIAERLNETRPNVRQILRRMVGATPPQAAKSKGTQGAYEAVRPTP